MSPSLGRRADSLLTPAQSRSASILRKDTANRSVSRWPCALLRRFLHSREKVRLVGVAGDLHALEDGIESDIRVQIASILVEMKKCTAGAREGPALALPQLRQLAQLHQQRL